MPTRRGSSPERSGPIFILPREFHVYLWDADNLVQPIATLPWRVGPPVRRRDAFPLVAISPDGKTVAVASNRGMLVKLYSARDGTPLKRTTRFGPGQTKDSSAEDLEIEPQAELTALALGPAQLAGDGGKHAGRRGDSDLEPRLAFVSDQLEPAGAKLSRG